MADDVFTKLAAKFNALPEQIQEAYEQATIESIDTAAYNLRTNLIQMSGSETLNKAMVSTTREIPHKYYERSFDWDDTRIVNIEQGKGVGRDINKPRAKGKRNFSLHPATYHDLAYIIDHGRGGKAGNSFIKRAMRRVRSWRTDRDINFERKLNEIGNEFTEE